MLTVKQMKLALKMEQAYKNSSLRTGAQGGEVDPRFAVRIKPRRAKVKTK